MGCEFGTLRSVEIPDHEVICTTCWRKGVQPLEKPKPKKETKPSPPSKPKKKKKAKPKSDATFCYAHPNYGVKRKPRTDCVGCWTAYENVHPDRVQKE